MYKINQALHLYALGVGAVKKIQNVRNDLAAVFAYSKWEVSFIAQNI